VRIPAWPVRIERWTAALVGGHSHNTQARFETSGGRHDAAHENTHSSNRRAKPGYDLVTGLGTVDAFSFAHALAGG
jgi:hypothetical protein